MTDGASCTIVGRVRLLKALAAGLLFLSSFGPSHSFAPSERRVTVVLVKKRLIVCDRGVDSINCSTVCYGSPVDTSLSVSACLLSEWWLRVRSAGLLGAGVLRQNDRDRSIYRINLV